MQHSMTVLHILYSAIMGPFWRDYEILWASVYTYQAVVAKIFRSRNLRSVRNILLVYHSMIILNFT